MTSSTPGPPDQGPQGSEDLVGATRAPDADRGPVAGSGVNGPRAGLLPPHRLRLLAAALDALVLRLPTLLLLLLGSLVVPAARSPWWVLVVLAVTSAVFTAGQLWVTDGETIGKAALGLRVLRAGGRPIPRTAGGLAWCLARQGGYLFVDVVGLGYLLALRTPRRRALHDVVLGSTVVRYPPSGALAALSPRTRAWRRARDFESRLDAGWEEVGESTAWLGRLYRRVQKLVLLVAAAVFWLADRAEATVLAKSAGNAGEVATGAPAPSMGTVAGTVVAGASAVVTLGVLVATYPSDAYTNVDVVTNFGTVGQPDTQEIYRMRADGGELRQLTRNGVYDGQPDLWRDERIVFQRQNGSSTLWVMSADGSGTAPVTRGSADDTDPEWSPDGDLIAFTRDGGDGPRVWVVDREGGGERPLTELPSRWPTWSPDGRRVAVVAADADGPGLFTVDLESGSPRRVSAPGATSEPRDPDWSPDGDWITYVDDRDGSSEVFLLPASGGTPLRLTDDPAEDYGAFWTPDGEAVLFNSSRGLDSGDELWLVRPDGSGLRQMTNVNAE